MTPKHVYAAPGSYRVVLRVTDDAGCSTQQTFTGQTVSCNGGPQATTFHVVSVSNASPPAVKPPGVKITEAKISSKHHQATFTFRPLGAATGFQCALVRQPKDKHKKRPKPYFSRCNSPKSYEHLSGGKYTFQVRAVNAAGPGNPASKSFKIT